MNPSAVTVNLDENASLENRGLTENVKEAQQKDIGNTSTRDTSAGQCQIDEAKCFSTNESCAAVPLYAMSSAECSMLHPDAGELPIETQLQVSSNTSKPSSNGYNVIHNDSTLLALSQIQGAGLSRLKHAVHPVNKEAEILISSGAIRFTEKEVAIIKSYTGCGTIDWEELRFSLFEAYREALASFKPREKEILAQDGKKTPNKTLLILLEGVLVSTECENAAQLVRPFAKEFLHSISGSYSLVFCTELPQSTAVNMLEPLVGEGRQITAISLDETASYLTHENAMMLADNLVAFCPSIEKGFPISTFTGSKCDKELLKILTDLIEMSYESLVPKLKEKFNLQALYERFQLHVAHKNLTSAEPRAKEAAPTKGFDRNAYAGTKSASNTPETGHSGLTETLGGAKVESPAFFSHSLPHKAVAPTVRLMPVGSSMEGGYNRRMPMYAEKVFLPVQRPEVSSVRHMAYGTSYNKIASRLSNQQREATVLPLMAARTTPTQFMHVLPETHTAAPVFEGGINPGYEKREVQTLPSIEHNGQFGKKDEALLYDDEKITCYNYPKWYNGRIPTTTVAPGRYPLHPYLYSFRPNAPTAYPSVRPSQQMIWYNPVPPPFPVTNQVPYTATRGMCQYSYPASDFTPSRMRHSTAQLIQPRVSNEKAATQVDTAQATVSRRDESQPVEDKKHNGESGVRGETKSLSFPSRKPQPGGRLPLVPSSCHSTVRESSLPPKIGQADKSFMAVPVQSLQKQPQSGVVSTRIPGPMRTAHVAEQRVRSCFVQQRQRGSNDMPCMQEYPASICGTRPNAHLPNQTLQRNRSFV